MTPKKTTKWPEPVRDELLEYDVTIRVRARGRAESIQPALRATFDRLTASAFPDAEVKRVRRAAR